MLIEILKYYFENFNFSNNKKLLVKFSSLHFRFNFNSNFNKLRGF